MSVRAKSRNVVLHVVISWPLRSAFGLVMFRYRYLEGPRLETLNVGPIKDVTEGFAQKQAVSLCCGVR